MKSAGHQFDLVSMVVAFMTSNLFLVTLEIGVGFIDTRRTVRPSQSMHATWTYVQRISRCGELRVAHADSVVVSGVATPNAASVPMQRHSWLPGVGCTSRSRTHARAGAGSTPGTICMSCCSLTSA